MPLKAGVVQFSPMYGRVVDNLVRLEQLVAEGVNQGAQLLVLPEMAWTGYLWPDADSVRPVCEEAGRGPGQNAVANWARKENVWISFGFPERTASALYNSQGLAAPDGRSHRTYRKSHLFEADEWWAHPGDSGFLQWESPWGPIGGGICMDLNFPDLVKFHASAGTSLLAFPTNWLDQDFDTVPYWEQRLAGIDGRAFLGLGLFANRGGSEFDVPFRGCSSVFWKGRCLASLPGKEDGVLVVELPWEPTGGI